MARMKDVNGLSATDRICNRHMARLLSELEDANCPSIFIEAVKGKLAWLRADLNEAMGTARHDESPILPSVRE